MSANRTTVVRCGRLEELYPLAQHCKLGYRANNKLRLQLSLCVSVQSEASERALRERRSERAERFNEDAARLR